MSDELARARNRRSRQRQKEDVRSHRFDLPNRTSEKLIDALKYFGRLTEAETSDSDCAEEEIGKLGRDLLVWFSETWREWDHSQRLEIPPIRVSKESPDFER